MTDQPYTGNPFASEWSEMPHVLRCSVPGNLIHALDRYVLYHMQTGGFLRALLENDLIEAVRRADPQSRQHLCTLADMLCEYAPAACYGSAAKVEAWIEAGKDAA